MRLRNRVSLVTGASRGIGRAIALTFAREGSDIIVNYEKSEERAREVASEIAKMDRTAIAVQADVSDRGKVFSMVERAMHEFGKIDILVNNAGVSWRPSKALDATGDEWERVLGVNLLGSYYCVQAVGPHMVRRKCGKIINMASIAAIGTSFSDVVAYGPSKAAVVNLTRRLAFELGPSNINVNAIAPGMIRTEMPGVGRSKEETSKREEEMTNVAALRRLGEPQDVANAALFLASDESSFITGQLLVVDGGRFNFLSHSL